MDGLQQVCNRLIVNVLPLTAAKFEQLKGRIYRQGQQQEHVDLVIPMTYAEIRVLNLGPIVISSHHEENSK